MTVIQLLPTLSYGDAIGNDVLALHEVLAQKGYSSAVYAESIDPRLSFDFIHSADKLPELTESDLIIYHASIGSAINQLLPSIKARKVMVFHNITPAAYFYQYNLQAFRLTEKGYNEIRSLAGVFDLCIADSVFNREELIRMGYTCPIEVCPIVIPFEDYRQEPDAEILERYRDGGGTDWLFVGRLAPNKKQEDVILSFCRFREKYDPSARLFLVGSEVGFERYALRLKNYVKKLGLEDSVIFSGHIRFRELLAYYRLADVFVCMSEHEGFCVPIVEAMLFSLPIVAADAGAVSDTMEKGGILLDDRSPELAAAAVHRLMTDKTLKAFILQEQKKNLTRFSYESVGNRFLQCLKPFL